MLTIAGAIGALIGLAGIVLFPVAFLIALLVGFNIWSVRDRLFEKADRIPGFRSGIRWKGVVASFGYLFLASAVMVSGGAALIPSSSSEETPSDQEIQPVTLTATQTRIPTATTPTPTATPTQTRTQAARATFTPTPQSLKDRLPEFQRLLMYNKVAYNEASSINRVVYLEQLTPIRTEDKINVGVAYRNIVTEYDWYPEKLVVTVEGECSYVIPTNWIRQWDRGELSDQQLEDRFISATC